MNVTELDAGLRISSSGCMPSVERTLSSGKREQRAQLFDVGTVHLLSPRPETFHAQLAESAPNLFEDEDFAAFSSEKMDRPSVPPTLVALTLLLQCEAGVSDEEARTIFITSVIVARWAGLLRGKALRFTCIAFRVRLTEGARHRSTAQGSGTTCYRGTRRYERTSAVVRLLHVVSTVRRWHPTAANGFGTAAGQAANVRPYPLPPATLRIQRSLTQPSTSTAMYIRSSASPAPSRGASSGSWM